MKAAHSSSNHSRHNTPHAVSHFHLPLSWFKFPRPPGAAAGSPLTGWPLALQSCLSLFTCQDTVLSKRTFADNNLLLNVSCWLRTVWLCPSVLRHFLALVPLHFYSSASEVTLLFQASCFCPRCSLCRGCPPTSCQIPFLPTTLAEEVSPTAHSPPSAGSTRASPTVR